LKKIIHPTDFSENASKALEYAIGLSQKFDAELILLNIGSLPTTMNSPSSMSSFSEMEDVMKVSIMGQLRDYAASNKKTMDKNLKIQFKAKLNSSTVNGILEAINESDADLVVVGTKGQSKLKEIIVGSTTKALVSKASCPVLAIPEKAIFGGFNKIVYASDFDPNDLDVIQRVTAMAQLYEASISVLHIFTKEPGEHSDSVAFQQWLTEVVKYPNIKFDSLVSDKAAKSLADYILDSKADLVVFFEKENTFIGGLFHKGMVKQFVDHAATIPLMSYNIHAIRNSGKG